MPDRYFSALKNIFIWIPGKIFNHQINTQLLLIIPNRKPTPSYIMEVTVEKGQQLSVEGTCGQEHKRSLTTGGRGMSSGSHNPKMSSLWQ